MSNVAMDEAVLRAVAAAALVHKTNKDIAAALGISAPAVAKAMADSRYDAIAASGAESAIGPALSKTRVRMAKLTDKVMDRIERILDSGSDQDALKASAMVLKGIGLEEQEQKQQDSQIHVYLGNADEPKSIEVISDES